MLSGGFGEPLAYSLRIEKILRHDAVTSTSSTTTSAWSGILKLHREGGRSSRRCTTRSRSTAPSRSISRDALEALHDQTLVGFLRMQVPHRQTTPAVLTVSHNSKIDINAQMQVPLERLTVVVPVGVDHTVFRPTTTWSRKGR